MSKQLSIDLTYDAPVADVAKMIADPAFRERVCDAQHALSRSVTVDGRRVAIVYTQKVEGVPSFATKLVGESIEVHQDETWSDDFTSGDITVALPGKPGELSGTARLTDPDGTGTRTVETIALTATVRVPLVAGKLEDLILGIFEKALTKEHQVGVAWLGER
ncbi:DUF2505 domain-containing protein [Nocardioides sp. DS6]|uniref:DUF2505 domain-containing protein n=1 Tax=Nocardioides eburneus TaxID=3231482 RepID=A0ABV3T0Y8_9ACTN